MSQTNNFYPITNAFAAMAAFARLKELGARVNGAALPDITFQVFKEGGVYHLSVDKVDGTQGYRIKVDDKPLEYPSVAEATAEAIMKSMIVQYEDTYQGKLPFVSMVQDGDDNIKLLLDGTLVVTSIRGKQLVKLMDKHSDLVATALDNILTSAI